MNLDRFVRERGSAWQELTALTDRSKGKAERLGPSGVLRMGTLYRQATADLALARRRWPGDPVVSNLESLVARGRTLVYESERRKGTIGSFFARDYWVRVRERPGALVAGAVFLLVPLLLAMVWAMSQPGDALGFVPESYHSVVEPREPGGLGLTTGEQAAFSSAIFTNNIRVSFLAFALGITGGIGTALLLAYNGIFIGAIMGLAIGAGNGSGFFTLVLAHGVLELSCIIVTGAAGFRIGWAIVSPGNLPRSKVVMEESRRAIEIVLGTVPWLILAGLIEGFITPSALSLPEALVIGVFFGSIYWALVAWRGRPITDAPSTSS